MPGKVRFSKEDIGGEILPILTTGLYRDILDTLREYVQNAIDAHCKQIEIIIDPDTITISDDGAGMSFDKARKAIKLGVSEKSPIDDVGFRGIGIYSAFNLCNSLEIYTRSARSRHCHAIYFDFKNIREDLLRDQERRKQGKPSSLYLGKLLEDAVYVEIDEDDTLTKRGSRCIMSGLLGHVYQHLNNWDKVVNYLQDVVPLPFRPDFKYTEIIKKKFQEEDYRVVPVRLQIGNRQEWIYRPYHNEMFAHGGEHPPKFFELTNKKVRFGFAWVCINDARRVLKDPKLRGLLIKKFGFSISDRNFLEHYFGRTVVNRRISGDVIIQHKDLIPNAARSDFEHNSTRQAFLQSLPRFVKSVTKWGNRIQDEDKAKEVLAEVLGKVHKVNRELPKVRRDRERLLQLNVELHELTDQIHRYAKVIKQIAPALYTNTDSLIKECQKFVKSALVKRKKIRRDIEKKIIRSIQREAAADHEENERLKDVPANLVALIEAYGLLMSEELMDILQFLDENILQVRLNESDYKGMILSLRDLMEERL